MNIYRDKEEFRDNLAVFEADWNNNFTYEDIIVKQDGVGYKIYLDTGDEKSVSAYCEVPHVHTLLVFLARLTGKRPVFTTLSEADWIH